MTTTTDGSVRSSLGLLSSTPELTLPEQTGPTVTEKASSALNSASQSASSTANSAAQSAKQTADAYLPESVSSKLPGAGSSSTSTSGVTTGSVDSPYVPLSQDKVRLFSLAHIRPDQPELTSLSRSIVLQPTSTLPSSATKSYGADSALVSDFSSGTGTSKQFSGLEPATTAQLPSASTTGSVAHPTRALALPYV